MSRVLGGIDHGRRERRVLVGVSLLTKRSVQLVKILTELSRSTGFSGIHFLTLCAAKRTRSVAR
ncbi:hypothetical protein JOE33_002480 [Pseudomonas sp. PvP027]|nr:hypothetical protein [Pseudomonas sp. PvP027]